MNPTVRAVIGCKSAGQYMVADTAEHMTSSTLRIVVLALASAMLCTACSVTRRCGDATYSKCGWLVQNLSPGVIMNPIEIRLPEFPVDKPGRYEFRVEKLPQSEFPSTVFIVYPHEKGDPGWKDDPPWKSVELHVTFTLPSGKLISSGRVKMQQLRPGVWSREAPIWVDWQAISAAGKPKSYKVIVQVIHPSKAKGDRAFLIGFSSAD